MNTQKYIGLLGLADATTRYYLERYNDIYQNVKGGFSTAPIKMLNLDFAKINPYLPDQYESLAQPLQAGLDQLWDMDVDHIIIPNITLHNSLSYISTGFDKDKILHIWKNSLDRIKSNDKIVIVATQYTMDYDPLKSYIPYQRKRLTEPIEKEVEAIRKTIYRDPDYQEAITSFHEIIRSFHSETVLLACTELSIAYQRIGMDYPNVIDLVEQQIQSSVRRILSV